MPRRIPILLLCSVLLASALASPAAATDDPHIDPQPRIIGGVESAPTNWPSQAALLDHSRADNFQAQFCGATVVAPSWVLTAGHCLDRGFDEGKLTAADLDVLTGTQDLMSGGQRVRAVEIRYLPGWNNLTLQNDLALVRLDQPTTAPPMPLIPQGRAIAPGTTLTTTGWGNQEVDGNAFPATLFEVELPYVADSKCASIYGDELDAAYRSGVICAGFLDGTVADSCNGDSGGPISSRIGGTWTQVGIVSWGIGCADPAYPGIYTRLAKYSDWVKAQLRFGAHSDAAAFVRQQYSDFFGRVPTDQELFLATLLVKSGSLADYVASIVGGAEWQRSAGGVARLYSAYFGRDADTAGLKFWINRVQRGSSNPVSSAFAASSEFATAYGSLSNQAFVDLVYKNVLDRPSDTGGIDFWTDQLNAGRRSRGQVMTGFSESNEYKRKTRPSVDVTTTYYALLRRLPTPAESSAWSGRPNVELVRSILGSMEYAKRF